jgi:hypothetical protein
MDRLTLMAYSLLMEEVAIREAADQMMKLHGNDARIAAGLKADAMLNKGYIEGFYAWNRIAAVISDLGCKSRQNG